VVPEGRLQNAATATPSAIGATTAWRTTTGSSRVRRRRVDTGVDPTPSGSGHDVDGWTAAARPDFVSCDDGADFCTGAANARVANDLDGWDADRGSGRLGLHRDLPRRRSRAVTTPSATAPWHGTRVAALIAARTDNAARMAGIAPGGGSCRCGCWASTGYTSDVVAAMRWAAGLAVGGVVDNPYPAAVLNLSLGAAQPCSITEQEAVTEIQARGVVIVASAGNTGGPVSAPANCQGVIAVAGLRHLGTKVGYSNVSSTAASVSIAAPAGNCVNIAAGSECLYSIETASMTAAPFPATRSTPIRSSPRATRATRPTSPTWAPASPRRSSPASRR
jgi:serine protease